jgi:phosphoribosyl 1,2-cyclic phosphodiesterase
MLRFVVDTKKYSPDHRESMSTKKNQHLRIKKSCFPKDSFLKDNPELHFNPGAADKWIQLLGYDKNTISSSLL